MISDHFTFCSLCSCVRLPNSKRTGQDNKQTFENILHFSLSKLKHDDEHTIIETAETCKITTVLISEDFWAFKYAQLHAKYAQLHKQILL